MLLDKKPSKEQNTDMCTRNQYANRLSTYNKEKLIRDIDIAINKNKKIIIGALVALFLIPIFSHIMPSNEKEGFYGDTKWGMSIEEVQKVEDVQQSDNNLNMFSIQKTDIENVKGADGTVSFYFVNGMLDEVMVVIVVKDMTDAACDKLYHKISKRLTNQFGKHTNELGSLVRHTEKSRITLIRLGNNVFIIRYKDIETVK